MDVARAGAFSVLNALATFLKSLDLQLFVSLFTQLGCLFVVPVQNNWLPGGGSWAQGKPAVGL